MQDLWDREEGRRLEAPGLAWPLGVPPTGGTQSASEQGCASDTLQDIAGIFKILAVTEIRFLVHSVCLQFSHFCT